MDMIRVTFKDDNGQWSEELSLIQIAKLSHSAASKILRFGHSDRVRELEVCLEDITRTPITMNRNLDAYESQFTEIKRFAQKGLDGDQCFKNVIDEIHDKNVLITSLQAQVARLKVLVEERDKTLDEYDARNNPAVAAIQYAIEQCDMGSAVEFLTAWNEGDFDALREEWDNVPDEVFEGADPLHGL